MSAVLRALSRACLCSTALCSAAFADTPPDSAAAETVIVTAARYRGEPAIVAEARERLSRTPGTVAVVAAEAFAAKLAVGFPDMLASVPGVISAKRYGEESRLSIRGSGIDQAYHQRGVLLAQDGVPFADADGFSDFQKVDALSARFIEVYKGGNALRFGGAQLGGAINLVTPTGRTALAENEIRLEAGSFGTVRAGYALAREAGDFDVYAAIRSLSADGYRTHSEQAQTRGTINLGYRFGEAREVRLIVYGADINQEVPGTLSLDDALNHPRRAGAGVVANDWARDQSVFRASLQTAWRFGEALGFEGGVYATATDLHHPIPIVIDQQLRTAGAFGRFDWTGEIGGHRADLFFGASYRAGRNEQGLFNNNGGANGFQFGDAVLDASGLDVFAEARWFATDALALVVGASYGRATRDYVNRLNASNDAEATFDWIAPRFGLLWESESGVQVYANYTRSVEPPHYGALVQAPYPGFVPVEPQKAWTAEIGTRGRSGAWTWDVAAFRSEIEGELLSYTATVGLPAALFNAGTTVHQGIEASLDWRILDRLTLRQTWAWSDFRFDGDAAYGDNRLPVVPRHQYRAALKYEDASGFFIEPSVDWRPGRTFVDYANTLSTPGYTLVNLSLGWTLDEAVTLFLDMRNLNDVRYVGEFGAITDASSAPATVFYPGEGRSAFGGVTVRF